jgi:hypothetical protein
VSKSKELTEEIRRALVYKVGTPLKVPPQPKKKDQDQKTTEKPNDGN